MNIPPIVPEEYSVLPRVTLHVCATDRFKIGQLSFVAALPDTRQTMLASELLLPVLRRGSERYPTQELLNRHWDDLYATDCRIFDRTVGDVRCMGFITDFPESFVLPNKESLLPEIIDTLTDMLFHPVEWKTGALAARYVESERTHLIDAIAALVNQPASYAEFHFRQAFANGRETVAPLCAEDVENLPPAALVALLKRMMDQAHFHVFYLGNTPAQQLIGWLRDRLTPYLNLTSKPVAASRARAICLPPRTQILSVDERLPVSQSHLILGYRTEISLLSKEFCAMLLCNEMLGGGPISRLFVHLREEKSLCYSCHSEYRMDRGELVVYCAIDASCRRAAQQVIEEQIAALQQGAFSDSELEAAKQLLLNDYRQLEDSTRAVFSFYHVRRLLGVCQTTKDCRDALVGVTRADVMAAARSLRQDTVYCLYGTAESEEQEEMEPIAGEREERYDGSSDISL